MKDLVFIVVDDAIFMRAVLTKMLTEEGYTVVAQATNGLEAIEYAQAFKPHMMTLDITMPQMDGLEAIPEILKVSPHTKIIMCSAMGQQSKVLEAMKKGASDFIVKPFEKEHVLQAIANVRSGENGGE